MIRIVLRPMAWYDPSTWFPTPGLPVGLENYSVQKRNFQTFNGRTIYFNLNTREDYLTAYHTCPPLKAIINLRAQMFCNAEVEILNRRSDNVQRNTGTTKMLRDVLKRPNVIQSWRAFFSQYHIYLDLFGFCPVLKINPVGMPGVISALWIIPPWLFEVEFTGKLFFQTDVANIYKAFWLNFNGRREQLDLNNVLLALDGSIATNSEYNYILPDSRVKSCEYPISNIFAIFKSHNTLISKKGAIGILSNTGTDTSGPLPMKEGEKQAVQDDFKRYGLMGEEWQVIISEASLKWQPMAFPVKDLMLFEGMQMCVESLCDGLGLYWELLAHHIGATFSNQDSAEKAQYQNKIIPDATSRIEQLSSFIIPESENAYLDVSYSHIESLQESTKETAAGLKAQAEAFELLWDLGLVTRNDILIALDRDKINNPAFDKYNWQLTPEEGGTPPLPTTFAGDKKGAEGSTPASGSSAATPGQPKGGV